MPEQFENGRKLDGKSSLQHFNAKETYLHPKSRSVLFQKCLKIFCFHHFQLFTRCLFRSVSVRVPFSKSTVFKICGQKMCRFHVNGRPIRRIFHRFQNVPASCERSLISHFLLRSVQNLSLKNCYVNDIGAQNIGEALATNKNLLTLNLCFNKITCVGAQHIATVRYLLFVTCLSLNFIHKAGRLG